MSIAALEARLAAFEAAVGAAGDARGVIDGRSARDAIAEVEALYMYKGVESKEANVRAAADFFRKYAQLDPSLSLDADLELSFLNSETKAAIILQLANEEMLREAAGHVETTSKLQKFVKPAASRARAPIAPRASLALPPT
eukprot:tig00000473_g1207.t1